MSDWEIVQDQPQANRMPSQASSDWEMVQPEPNSQQPRPQEGVGTSLGMAVPRMAEDLYRGAMGFTKKVPGYFQAAKTEIPGVIRTAQDHPGHLAQQALAGLAEQGQNIFNTPHDILNYAANRLNLFPKDWNEKVQMGRMPNSEQDINSLFGTPQFPGEAMTRGTARNSLTLVPAVKAASALNPMNLSAKSIANDVLKAEKQQVSSHSKRYNKIWDQADKSGFNQVPVDQKLLSDNLSTIEKYKTPREYQSLEDFILDPKLSNAQKAQSDMGIMHRKLEEKSRSGALTSEELALYNAAKNSEKHIESHMFKDQLGNVNHKLQNKYQKLTNSYRENVVPYKYNSDIQAYKNKEMLPKELVNALSRGEFAAKKGSAHPAIGIRNTLRPIATGAGLLGGGSWLYNQMFGSQPPTQ
jgi:hypothetical protein